MTRSPNQLQIIATATAATTARLEGILRAWRARHEALFTAASSHDVFEAFFLEKLQTNKGSLDAVYIVGLAKRGHPSADRALRRLIIQANEEDRFQALPLSVRAYNSELLVRAPGPIGYSSRAPQTINHFNRDLAISWLISAVGERYPDIPLLYFSRRRARSAASIVGGVFGLTERQARRIFKAHGGLPAMIAEFFLLYTNTLPNEPVSFGR
jgi:hypothetical protein